MGQKGERGGRREKKGRETEICRHEASWRIQSFADISQCLGIGGKVIVSESIRYGKRQIEAQ